MMFAVFEVFSRRIKRLLQLLQIQIRKEMKLDKLICYFEQDTERKGENNSYRFARIPFPISIVNIVETDPNVDPERHRSV